MHYYYIYIAKGCFVSNERRVSFLMGYLMFFRMDQHNNCMRVVMIWAIYQAKIIKEKEPLKHVMATFYELCVASCHAEKTCWSSLTLKETVAQAEHIPQ